MGGLLRRWVNLNSILGLRHGPAAFKLPSEVTCIHMDFAKHMGGHMGPRKFWRTYLPQLKYHNPAVPMIINRREDQAGPAVMSIYFRKSPATDEEAAAAAATTTGKSNKRATMQPASSNFDMCKAPPPAADERVVTIDMKDRHSDQILELFLAESGAVKLEPTAREKEELEKFEEERKRLDDARKESERLKKLAQSL